MRSKVRIKSCIFKNNKASTDESLALFGGSSIFLTSRNARISKCEFIDNEGIDVKLFNSFDTTKRLSLLNQGEKSVVILNCKFTINENEISPSPLLLYVAGMNSVPVEIRECSFAGKLRNGSHYIDGKVINENAQKLVVKKCRFDDNQINSINVVNQKSLKKTLKVDNQNNYISIDFNDQIFKVENKEDTNVSKKFEMINFTAVFAVGMIVAGLIVFVLKKLNNRNSNDNEDDTLLE